MCLEVKMGSYVFMEVLELAPHHYGMGINILSGQNREFSRKSAWGEQQA
jgi:hypothetical protein